MKKICTLLFAVFCVTAAFAQLPDGSVAPDFTGKDINGKTWKLYDILNEGKPVIMDVSATWCGPCWAYHNTHAMRDVFEAHGPNGDNKMMAFFIEGDDATNGNCLHGSAGCVGGTQGDWVTGTPYPIIDDHNIANAYEIGYFPTIYLICPDRIVTEIGQKNAATLWAGIQNCGVATGKNNANIFKFSSGAETNQVCGSVPVFPTITLMNYGTDPMKSATVTLKWKGNVKETVNWTGSLATYNTDEIDFGQFDVTDAGQLSVEVSNVNGQVDDDPANNTKSVDFAIAPEFSTQRIYVRIKTDQYPEEFYWEFRDADGNVIDKGGNQKVGATGGGKYTSTAPPSDPSMYTAKGTIIRDTLTMPAHGCFSFLAVDAFGDGFTNGTASTADDGYYRLSNLGSSAVIVGNGGEYVTDNNPFSGKTFVNIEDVVPTKDFDVYPNPASKSVNVEFVLNRTADVQLAILNSLGQTVRTESSKTLGNGLQVQTLQIADLPNGMYLLNLRTAEGMISKKFTVQN